MGLDPMSGSHGYEWLYTMSDYMQDIDLVVRAFVDNDFEIDPDGRCYIVNLIYTNDDDEPYEARVDLEGVIDSLIDGRDNLQGYQTLYAIAHELSRHAQRLRDIAGAVEDSDEVVGDLFDIDD